MTPREILTNALALAQGDTIIIPCADHHEMERIRTSLYRERKALEEFNFSLGKEFTISREVQQGQSGPGSPDKYFVYIRRIEKINEAFICRKDGTIEQMKTDRPQDPDLERICALMQQDGCSDEEIAEYRRNYGKELSGDNAEKVG